jgi:hypothetical protein
MKYTIENGTSYSIGTAPQVVAAIESARLNDRRIRVYYGDTATGRDWGETCYTIGRIGRSMGPVKIPLLIYSRRCYGGCGILCDCIVKIEHSNKRDGGTIYQHPKYHTTLTEGTAA